MSKWISVEDHLPNKEGTYLVKTGEAIGRYPSSRGGEDIRRKISYHGSNIITDDIAHSIFKPNYKKPWSIERCPGCWAQFGGRVTHWAYLPGDGEDDE